MQYFEKSRLTKHKLLTEHQMNFMSKYKKIYCLDFEKNHFWGFCNLNSFQITFYFLKNIDRVIIF